MPKKEMNTLVIGTKEYEIVDATARSGLSSKQDTLVSGTNIKTINNESLLGSGNIAVGGDANVIESISVNNVQQTVTNKNVNIDLTDYALTDDIPTAVSELTNDSEFQTASDVTTTLANDGDPYQTESDVSSAITTALSNSGDTYQTASDVQNYVSSQGFITNTVNNLTNYYLKSELYTKSEVDNLISAISTMSLEVVQTLPTEDISTTTIYLLPKQSAGTQNVYDEYIYLNNSWELIGNTEIDLSSYYTKTEVDNALSDTTGTLESEISDISDALDTKQATLVSGTNIKTINSNSLLGNGNIALQETLVSGTNIKTINNTSLLGSGDISIQSGDTNIIETVKVNNAPLTPDANKAVNIDLSGYATTSALSNKQDTLVSGTNIKTINSQSLLGEGNIAVQPTLVSGTNIKTINNESLLGSGNITVQGGVTDVTVNGTSVVNAQGVAELNSDFKIFQLTSSTGGTPSTYAQIREAYSYYLTHPTSTFICIDGFHVAYSHDNTTDKKMFFYIGTTIPNMLPNNPNMMLLYFECDYTNTSTAVLESAGDIILQPSRTGDLVNNGDGTQGSLYATQTWVQNYIASLDGNNTGY